MWSLCIGTLYGSFTRNGSGLYENSISVVHDDTVGLKFCDKDVNTVPVQYISSTNQYRYIISNLPLFYIYIYIYTSTQNLYSRTYIYIYMFSS